MITQEKLMSLYFYDKDTGLFTSTSKRYSWNAGRIAGYTRKYIKITIDGKQHFAHRLAWLYMTGEMPERQIDHINGDKHDNRFSNLRLATQSENSQNILKPRKDCASGFKGVAWRERNKRWHATIRVDGKSIHLGYFYTPEDAHTAYVEAKREYHLFLRAS